MENLNYLISIGIKTLDCNEKIKISQNATIIELKEKIKDIFHVSIEQQRLIYQGRVLQDKNTLKSSNLTDNCVVHLLTKTENEINQPQNTQEIHERRIRHNQNEQNFTSLPSISSLFQILHQRALLKKYDISECFETLYQTSLTIENLMKCRKKYQKNSQIIFPFDTTKAHYKIGQWIDVKDTTNTWIEGQIIKTSENKGYVHYNGWDKIWDEWIDFSSSRISNFKTFTFPSTKSYFSSPYPSVICDSEELHQNSRSIDSFYYLDICNRFLKDIIPQIDYLVRIKKRRGPDCEILFHILQLIPLIDRIGRMMSDISMAFSNLIVDEKLIAKMILGYSDKEIEEKVDMIRRLNTSTREVDLIQSLDDLEKEISSKYSSINNFSNINSTNQFKKTNPKNDIFGFEPPIRTQRIIPVTHSNTSNNIRKIDGETNYPRNSEIREHENNSSSTGYNRSSRELALIRRINATHNENQNNDPNSDEKIFLNSLPKINLQSPAIMSQRESGLMLNNNEPRLFVIPPQRTINSNTNHISTNNPNTNRRSNENLIKEDKGTQTDFDSVSIHVNDDSFYSCKSDYE